MQWPAEGPFLSNQSMRLPDTDKPSAINKQMARDAVWLGIDGLRGDSVADRRFHGGPDRSLCHYPAEHYGRWHRLYPHLALGPAAFGENISTLGIDEHEVCIGDHFRWGDALIEVSQPRSPCGNLDRRHGARGLARQLAMSGKTGWLYRTLEPGEITPGAALCLIERCYPTASVAHIWRSFVNDATPDSELARLAGLTPLAIEYRRRFRERFDSRRRQHDQHTLF